MRIAYTKVYYAIALVDEGDEYVKESIIENKYFPTKKLAQQFFNKWYNEYIRIEPYAPKSDWEIIEIIETVKRKK